MTMTIKKIIVLSLCMMTVLSSKGWSADTTEQFDKGLSDAEMHTSYWGIGNAESERGVGAEFVLGAGVTDWLSVNLATCAQANDSFAEGTGSTSFGIFTTPVDTEHFDLDYAFGVSLCNLASGKPGPADHMAGEFSLEFYIELNLDSSDDMDGYGFYLGITEVRTGIDESEIDMNGEEIRKFIDASFTELVGGVYITVAEGQQLFLAYDWFYNHGDVDYDHATGIGGVALGYNFCITDNVEIISEIYYDLPQDDDEDPGTAITIGFISTLPPVGK
jgi:hypothetical protein